MQCHCNACRSVHYLAVIQRPSFPHAQVHGRPRILHFESQLQGAIPIRCGSPCGEACHALGHQLVLCQKGATECDSSGWWRTAWSSPATVGSWFDHAGYRLRSTPPLAADVGSRHHMSSTGSDRVKQSGSLPCIYLPVQSLITGVMS